MSPKNGNSKGENLLPKEEMYPVFPKRMRSNHNNNNKKVKSLKKL